MDGRLPRLLPTRCSSAASQARRAPQVFRVTSTSISVSAQREGERDFMGQTPAPPPCLQEGPRDWQEPSSARCWGDTRTMGLTCQWTEISRATPRPWCLLGRVWPTRGESRGFSARERGSPPRHRGSTAVVQPQCPRSQVSRRPSALRPSCHLLLFSRSLKISPCSFPSCLL